MDTVSRADLFPVHPPETIGCTDCRTRASAAWLVFSYSFGVLYLCADCANKALPNLMHAPRVVARMARLD